MEILTTEDFNQIPYNVPNAQAQAPEGGTLPNVQFQNYIDKKVRRILVRLLGQTRYESFIAGLDALPPEWVGTNTPGYAIDDLVFYNYHVWQSLVDNNLNVVPAEGISWTMVEDDRWLMLYNGVGNYNYYSVDNTWVGMKNLLVPYVYAYWTRDTMRDHTKSGMAQRNQENATIVSSAPSISFAYNEFSTIAGDRFHKYNSLYGYLMYAQSLGHFDDSSPDTFSTYLSHAYDELGNMNPFNI
jgi:hypothetical protein